MKKEKGWKEGRTVFRQVHESNIKQLKWFPIIRCRASVAQTKTDLRYSGVFIVSDGERRVNAIFGTDSGEKERVKKV